MNVRQDAGLSTMCARAFATACQSGGGIDDDDECAGPTNDQRPLLGERTNAGGGGWCRGCAECVLYDKCKCEMPNGKHISHLCWPSFRADLNSRANPNTRQTTERSKWFAQFNVCARDLSAPTHRSCSVQCAECLRPVLYSSSKCLLVTEPCVCV